MDARRGGSGRSGRAKGSALLCVILEEGRKSGQAKDGNEEDMNLLRSVPED